MHVYSDARIRHSYVKHASRSSFGLTAGLVMKYNKVKHESISLATGSVRHQLSDLVSAAIADGSEESQRFFRIHCYGLFKLTFSESKNEIDVVN